MQIRKKRGGEYNFKPDHKVLCLYRISGQEWIVCFRSGLPVPVVLQECQYGGPGSPQNEQLVMPWTASLQISLSGWLLLNQASEL